MELSVFVQNFANQFDETDAEVFTPETRFRDLDEWSSLIGLSIILMVDEEYGITLGAEEIADPYFILGVDRCGNVGIEGVGDIADGHLLEVGRLHGDVHDVNGVVAALLETELDRLIEVDFRFSAYDEGVRDGDDNLFLTFLRLGERENGFQGIDDALERSGGEHDVDGALCGKACDDVVLAQIRSRFRGEAETFEVNRIDFLLGLFFTAGDD